MITNKKIVITGSAGSIGSELVRQLVPYNDICAIDFNETELFDLHEELKQKGFKRINSLFGDIRNWETFRRASDFISNPDFVFHCAALKHVTPSAWSPEEYVKTNILGTINAIQYARRFKARLVNISTDKVVDPCSIMGATKKVAEIAVRDAGFVSVRFGNVMGSRGSVLEIWQKQIEQRRPLTITDKRMKRFMMTIPEAVGLVIRAAEIGQPSQIIVLNMGQQISIVELAERILKEKRSNVGLDIIGMKPGEKFEEVLMTEAEKGRVRDAGDFFIIPPEWVNYNKNGEPANSKT